MAGGGDVKGPLARDSVPTMLMPGEFVMKRSAVDAIGKGVLNKVNGLGASRISEAAPPAGAMAGMMPAPPAPINLWVAHPDQIPTPGPNDIIHHVATDIQRGGQTKTLIRQP